jgi:hypothetical protein
MSRQQMFLQANVRQLVRRLFKEDHDRWGNDSLDLPIVRTTLRVGDTVTRGLLG